MKIIHDKNLVFLSEPLDVIKSNTEKKLSFLYLLFFSIKFIYKNN